MSVAPARRRSSVGDDIDLKKKSLCSTEVRRQCIGAFEKIIDCRIWVFFGYATSFGHALERDLLKHYLCDSLNLIDCQCLSH